MKDLFTQKLNFEMPSEDLINAEVSYDDVLHGVGAAGGSQDGEGSENEDWSVSDESGEDEGAGAR